MTEKLSIEEGDALLIVDVQLDFCPGGALPVEDGDAVIPVLNAWTETAGEVGARVYASRDWHPSTHLSFSPHGGDWPPHCIQDTDGASFHPDLMIPTDVALVTKGTRFDKDQHSAFDDTGLADELKNHGVRRIWIGGLALDVCVRATALDARREGFEVHLIKAATRPVTPQGGADALEELRREGVIVE